MKRLPIFILTLLLALLIAGCGEQPGAPRAAKDGVRIVRIAYLPMRHGSARGIGDRCRALWGGFAIETADGARAFFCGDTAWGQHLAEIGERLGPFDVALLPIGAYEPRWFMQTVHMNVEEALQAHRALRARTSIAMHFGVFKLTREPIGEPAERLLSLRGEADFRIPAFGETLTVPISRSG